MQSNKSAKDWRQMGNESFQQKQYHKALECYTRSVLEATHSASDAPATDDFSLAYANRSAALYHMDNYKLSLQDIDLALDHGYPNNLLFKLHQRKGLCLLGLGSTEAINAFTTTLQLIESHTDIDEVKKTSLRAEVEKHLQTCLQRNQLKKSDMVESSEIKHFPGSKVISNASSSICLQYNAVKGRHLVANSPVQAGSILIQESPFASVLLPDHYSSHCHFCHTQLIAPVPCDQCRKVLYCSRDCQQSAWEEHHSVECHHWETLQQVGTFAWLSLRIVLTARSEADGSWMGLDESGIPGCESDGSYKAGYHAVCSLVPHTHDQTEEEMTRYKQKAELLVRRFHQTLMLKLDLQENLNQTTACDEKLSNLSIRPCDEALGSADSASNSQTTQSHSNKSDLAKAFDPDEESISDIEKTLTERLTLHMQQLKCNSHAITAVKAIGPDGGGDRSSGGGPSRNVESTEQVRIATAVYATTSLMNHSCEPNVIASFQGRQLTIRAIKDIQENEEILHCYGPHAKHMATSERQKALQEQYFFTCRCVACKQDTAKPAKETVCDWSRAFQCGHCTEPLIGPGSNAAKNIVRCDGCQREVKVDDLKRQESRASRLFSQAMVRLHNDDSQKCLPILQQCYEIRTQVLYKHHRDLAETQDCIARCYASIGNFRQAGDHLELSVETIQKIYGADSIELANELHKIAQVYFNGREVKKALDVIEKALRLFTVHYGANHESIDELQQMRMCLLQQMEMEQS